MFRCFCTIFRELRYCVCQSHKILKLLKLHKTADHCMKSVLLIKCGSGCVCNSKVLFWCVYCASQKFPIRKIFQDNQSRAISLLTRQTPKSLPHAIDRQKKKKRGKFLKIAVIYYCYRIFGFMLEPRGRTDPTASNISKATLSFRIT
jgi:hypothetical protein